MLNPSFRPQRNEETNPRDLGDECLFYDTEQDRVHILNATAREIYLLCDGNRSIEDVARSFAESNRIDTDTALADTTETVGRLIELGILAAA